MLRGRSCSRRATGRPPWPTSRAGPEVSVDTVYKHLGTPTARNGKTVDMVVLGIMFVVAGLLLAVFPAVVLPTVQRFRWMPFASSPTRNDWNGARASGAVVAALGLVLILAG